MLEWINSNKEWIFSGVGVTIVVGGLAWVINFLFIRRPHAPSIVQGLSALNIELAGIVDKLLNQLIDPSYHTKTQENTLFQFFITPVYQTFEEVHAAYIITLRKCRDFINRLEYPYDIQHLIAILEDEIRFTYHQREKLVAFTQSAKPEIAAGFMNAIIDYLQIPASELFIKSLEWPRNPVEEILHVSNPVRSSIINGLLALGTIIERADLAIKEPRNLKLFKTTLDQLLVNLQERYSNVVIEYISLRNMLYNTSQNG